MHGKGGLITIVRVESGGGGQQGKGGVDGEEGVPLGGWLLKDCHEPIPGGFVDVSAGGMDAVQKGREIAFDQSVEDIWCKPLAQVGIRTNVEEEDRDVALMFGELRGFRIGRYETLDRLW